MNVLSLFDGMAGGRLALQKLGITPTKYFASEIEVSSINVAKANFPEIIQLGDVANVKAADLPRIDILIGGSPCQGFSYNGNQLNLNDPRSKLFFHYLRLKNELKPTYFFLENVLMKTHFEQLISEFLGVSAFHLNSAKVSAQNRPRLYWTNLPFNGLSIKREILLKDIIDFSAERTFVDRNRIKSRIKTKNYLQYDLHGKNYGSQNQRAYYLNGKHACLVAANGKSKCHVLFENEEIANLTAIEAERLQTVPDNYTNFVSEAARFSMLGNGWTIDVITEFFKYFGQKPIESKNYQQSLFEWY